jgi:hypothetical protein
MPGTKLSKTEKDLLHWWKNAAKHPFPMLRSISIKGRPGLRGIQDLSINFNYPLTVISGKNGCGKTTALALTALGFHSPAGHKPTNARRLPLRGETSTYYTFSDFFFNGPNDPDITGVEIGWTYHDRKELRIQKRSKNWMHYQRRPERPVHYLGVIRCAPAIEQSALRAHFGKPKGSKGDEAKPLNARFCERLSDIMGRLYEEADVMSSNRYSVRRCKAGSSYSSFNMGAGEDVLIDLLYILQECPAGSLIVIEEIELGLHPEALVRLAYHLQEIISEKKIQVIVSTHSQHFIDNVPRVARVLIQKANGQHTVIEGPTTRFAYGLISGQLEPELHVYCEDTFAELLIKQALLGDQRRRVHVVPVGSKTELVKQAVFHLRAGHGQQLLLVWDGDVTDHEIRTWVRDECKGQYESFASRINWTLLPGGCSPEKWVVDALNCDDGFQLLGDELRQTPASTAELLEGLRAIREVHGVGYQLGKLTNQSVHESSLALARAASRLPSSPLSTIQTEVEALLNARRVNAGQVAANVRVLESPVAA